MKKILLIIFSLFTFTVFSQTTVNIDNKNVTVTSYSNSTVIVSGKSEVHITGTSQVLDNSTVNLTSADSWLVFDNIRPGTIISSYLGSVRVDGVNAVNNSNVRVSIYKQGTVIIPESSATQPLKVYTGQNFSGDSASYSLFTYYNSLGTMDNKIQSFKLKKGYMATFATSSNGTGYSRVFVADNADVELSTLPALLNQKISFIRVFSWEYVSKKGWCGWNANNIAMINATWHYDWDTGGTTDQYTEYVPMKWGGRGSFTAINSKTKITHVLGFNEPDHTDQSNLTLQQMIDMWPQFMTSGLRIGSPAWANPWSGNGGTLFDFINKCNQLNYRVDFVNLHCYWGGKSPQNWYNDLKYIHDATGRPLWITEWNNGANWTNESWPDASHLLTTNNAAKQLSDLKGILQVLDTASFVERYAIYNWVEDCRAMILNNGSDYLTPAGQYYANTDMPPFAYKDSWAFVPKFNYYGTPTLASSYGTGATKVSLIFNDNNYENYNGMIMEKKIDNGNFSNYIDNNIVTSTSVTDTLDRSAGTKFRYRMKWKWSGSNYSAYSNEAGWDFTNGEDIQMGTLSYNNSIWNPVFFNKPYTTIPAIILGSTSNENGVSVQVTPKPKLISASSRFDVQFSPWSYENVTNLSKEETVPYLVIKPGIYDFGGLRAIAAKTTINTTWTKYYFSLPFDSVPVVFASELLATSYPTVIRIRNITKTGFEAKLLAEPANLSKLSTENFSYLAVTPGKGTIDNKKMIVGKTADNTISNTAYTAVYYGDSITNPLFISQMQTCNDDTVAALMRYLNVTAKYTNLIKQREMSQGNTVAAKEQAGWMVIEQPNNNTGVRYPKVESLAVYPNPVKDILYLKRKSSDEMDVFIYNMYGSLVKIAVNVNDRITVNNLPPGCYILRTTNNTVTKFVKL